MSTTFEFSLSPSTHNIWSWHRQDLSAELLPETDSFRNSIDMLSVESSINSSWHTILHVLLVFNEQLTHRQCARNPEVIGLYARGVSQEAVGCAQHLY